MKVGNFQPIILGILTLIFTQIQLAEKLQIHNTVLSRIESGEKKSVDNHLLSKVADVFNVSADFLLGKTNDPTPSWGTRKNPEEHISFFDLEGLSPSEIEEVKKHIDYLRWKARQSDKP